MRLMTLRALAAVLIIAGWPADTAAQGCDVSWTNPAGGPWSTAANWSTAAVPTAGQNVCIVLDGTYTVTLGVGNHSVAGLTVGNAAGVATLLIQSAISVASSLTVTGDVTNSDVITLDGFGPPADTTLTSTTGTISNLAGATLNLVRVNGGGLRIVSGNLENAAGATINVAAPTTFTKADGQLTNNGIFTISPAGGGIGFTMTGAAPRFNQNGGTLTAGNLLQLQNGTFAFNGGAIDGARAIGIRTATLQFGGGTDSCVFDLTGAVTLLGNVPAGVTLNVIGGGSGAATLTSAASFSNAGSIVLDNPFAGGLAGAAILVVTSGTVTNAATGVITAQGSDSRFIRANAIVNDGTVNVNRSLVFDRPGGQYTNNATWSIAGGGGQSRLTIQGAGAGFSQNGGTLTINNELQIDAGTTFSYNGGAIGGAPQVPIRLTNASLVFGVGGTGAATFDINAACTLTGNVSAGQTLNLIGGGFGAVTLTSATGFTNGGTIILDNPFGGFSVGDQTLVVTSGTLTNAPTGVITIPAGSANSRFIRADAIVNNGTVDLHRSLNFDRAGGQYTNNATWNIAAGVGQGITLVILTGTFVQTTGTLTINNPFDLRDGTFTFNGGTITGTGVVDLLRSRLNLAAAATNAATFRMKSGCTMSGNLKTNQTVRVSGDTANATVTPVGDFTNTGTIVLENVGAFNASANIAMAAGVMTNGAGGVLTALGGGGARTIATDLTNLGTININGATSLTKVAGLYTNSGAIAATVGLTVAAGTFANLAAGTMTGGSLTIANGASLFGLGTITTNVTNNGTFNAGTSPGLFTIVGNFSQASTGAFNVEIGGLTAGTQFDRVVVTDPVATLVRRVADPPVPMGPASLSGAMNVSLIGGFTPVVGDSFQIMTFASRTGTFSPANGLDIPGPLRFRADYTATSLTLVVEAEPTFSISGRVSDLNDTPLAGITLSLTGGQTASAQTDAFGLYAFPALPATLNYTVTPSQTGFTFNPANRAFTNLIANQTANFIAATGVFRRFFAEGATGAFFDTLLGLLNATNTAANVTLRFLKGDGTTVNHPMTIPPLTRATLDVETVGGMNAAEFSTVVESNVPVITDRTMRWNQDGYGSHAETSIAAAATRWFFAEGATISGFNLFYLVQNANAAAADVRVTYLLPAPQAPIVKTHTVGPNSRYNIWVNLEHPILDDAEVSAVVEVTNNVPVIVERAMYLDSGGLPFGAGHESAGVLAPATDWFLAEGATGPFFDLFILLANPSNTAADVEVRYLLPTGTVLVRNYVSAANSRFNIWVDFEHPALADTAVSATIRSLNGVGIIVERAMWWPGSSATWHEGHNTAGATSTGTKWGLADGELGGPSSVETYILIANTSGTGGTAQVTLHFEDGTTTLRTFNVSANSRFNVNVAAEFPTAAGRRFGAIVEATGANPVQIVVERAMYSSARGVAFAAGTNVVGTRLR